MPTASERARELPPGPELDALFFETCWGWRREPNERNWWRVSSGNVVTGLPAVTRNAQRCESWVMRWLNEQGDLIWRVSNDNACIYRGDEFDLLAEEDGETWKHALTRAAIAAKEAMKGERDA